MKNNGLTAIVLALAFGLIRTASAENTCHVVMDGETTTNYYENIADAIWAIGTGTGVVTMIANDVITATNVAQRVDVDGDVTILSDGGDHTILRGPGENQFTMLYIGRINLNTNAVLTLGSPEMSGTLTFDGGSFLNRGGSIIQSYRGTLNMHEGIILKNNITEFGGGGVYNESVFNMFGGLIISNIAYGTGGGVQNAGFYGAPAVFNMYGGVIAYNQSLNGTFDWGGYGGAVANQGTATFNMLGGTIAGNEAEFAGGGVHNTQEIQSGSPIAAFNMSGGTISGNRVTDENGQGAGVYNDYEMTLEGDAVIDADNDVYLRDTVITVTGELTGEGPVATITSSNPDSGTPLITVADGSGVTLEDVIGFFALGSGTEGELVVDPDSGAIVLATPFEAWLLRRGHGFHDPDFAPDADMDGDGATTWEEFVADTDPADFYSVLAAVGHVESSEQVMTFPGSTNRMYALQFKLELADEHWQDAQSDIQGTNTTMSLVDTITRERVYYRIAADFLP